MNQGNDGSNNVPPRSSDDSPALGQRVYDTARVQRTPQIAFIRDRLDQGLSPATVAGVAAIIAQMESQVQAPMLTISITSGFPGFQRSMTYQDTPRFLPVASRLAEIYLHGNRNLQM